MDNSLSIVLTKSSDVVGQLVENPDAAIDLSGLLGDLTHEERVDAAAMLLDRIKAERAFFKEQADKFTKASRALDKLHEQLKDSIKLNMTSMCVDSLEGNSMRFKLVELEPKVDYEESLVPDEYKVQVITTKVNDSALKEALASGKRVEGATLVPVFRLTSYVNRKLKASER